MEHTQKIFFYTTIKEKMVLKENLNHSPHLFFKMHISLVTRLWTKIMLSIELRIFKDRSMYFFFFSSETSISRLSFIFRSSHWIFVFFLVSYRTLAIISAIWILSAVLLKSVLVLDPYRNFWIGSSVAAWTWVYRRHNIWVMRMQLVKVRAINWLHSTVFILIKSLALVCCPNLR